MGSGDRTSAVRQRRRFVMKEVMRLVGIAVVPIALYYLLPLNRLTALPLGLTLGFGLLVLGAVSAWQIRAVIGAENPSIRAIETLTGFIPLFLVLFAASYYVMVRVDPDSFDSALTHTDALYFTITVFSTVGFGDITATSQAARVAVMVQIVLNIIILGLGVRVLTRAVQISKTRQPADNKRQP